MPENIKMPNSLRSGKKVTVREEGYSLRNNLRGSAKH